MAKRLATFLILGLLVATGCGKTRLSQLGDRSDTFNRNLRWGSLAAASTFIADETRKTLMEQIARELAQNRIVEYAILDVGMDKSNRKGSVLVEYSYYGVSDQNLTYRQEMQVWQWNSSKRNWFLLETRGLPKKN